jgi:hypothetical protein
MTLVQAVCNQFRETYGPFFPTPKKKREAFIEQVRDRVAHYTPKIEERSGIELGRIEVKDNKHWLKDTATRRAHDNAIQNAWEQGRVPTERDFAAHAAVSAVAKALFIPFNAFYNMQSGADFRYHNKTIYAPFYFSNRFDDMDFQKRTERMDYGVVHDLSHAVWEQMTIASKWNVKQKESFFNRRLWFEGFATYCADEYFADFYPEGTKKVTGLPRVYTDGKATIEALVADRGTEIVLEIPKRWKEFSEENRNKRKK